MAEKEKSGGAAKSNAGERAQAGKERRARRSEGQEGKGAGEAGKEKGAASLRKMEESQEKAGEEKAKFGKYKGLQYESILAKDPDYCEWAKKFKNPKGQLAKFANYLAGAPTKTFAEGADMDNTAPLPVGT